MRIILDLDQTLVFAFAHWREERERPVNVSPDTVIRPSADTSYDLYFRPDIGLLKDIPFVIISTGGPLYVRAVADALVEKGFLVERAYDVSHLPTGDDVKPPITEEPALLIDDLAADLMGVTAKLAVLPRGVHCKVDAWTDVRIPKPEERRPDETLKEWFARPRSTVLELVHTEGSASLAECLRRVEKTLSIG